MSFGLKMVDTHELPRDDDHVEGGVPVGVLVVRVSSLNTEHVIQSQRLVLI